MPGHHPEEKPADQPGEDQPYDQAGGPPDQSYPERMEYATGSKSLSEIAQRVVAEVGAELPEAEAWAHQLNGDRDAAARVFAGPPKGRFRSNRRPPGLHSDFRSVALRWKPNCNVSLQLRW